MVLLTNHHLVTSHFNILSSCTGQNLSKQVLTEIGPVHTYPDIFESTTFSFWIWLPSKDLSGESGIRTRNFLNPLTRVEIFEYAMNSESCGRQFTLNVRSRGKQLVCFPEGPDVLEGKQN